MPKYWCDKCGEEINAITDDYKTLNLGLWYRLCYICWNQIKVFIDEDLPAYLDKSQKDESHDPSMYE